MEKFTKDNIKESLSELKDSIASKRIAGYVQGCKALFWPKRVSGYFGLWVPPVMALHFKCDPTELDQEQILDYLHYLKSQSSTPSSSYFKHTVYGLSLAYKVTGVNKQGVSLPRLKFPKRLPVVLSKQEIKRLLITPRLLKHRLVIAMLYGCGLRRFELLNIKLQDITLTARCFMYGKVKGEKTAMFPLANICHEG